ncbi:Flp pilus assembly pilin Flp [Rhodovulum iodosum]|uniref:Flp pilus assembly pilin Flp n=1 Tax=Rhodovulum iodosum TaxID=68291 RepID=A0ABV3XW88_9RHOB|nr:hypothetical protein [Rhodovulum robiginosum]RSK36762.1 hypothetical protein EJA01_04510 [Rhodovulum robiginosum]
MKDTAKKFVQDEDGAVTVDWIVLTAFVVGMALAVVAIFVPGPTNIASNISNAIAGITVVD